jgi:hypothetical protein
MIVPQEDTRTDARRRSDDQIAAEPPLPPANVGGEPKPMEARLGRPRRPVAIVGVVENGLIRPLDPTVTLPERSRVIIVAQDAI